VYPLCHIFQLNYVELYFYFSRTQLFVKTSKMKFSLYEWSNRFQESGCQTYQVLHVPFGRRSLICLSSSHPNSLATIHLQHVWTYRSPCSCSVKCYNTFTERIKELHRVSLLLLFGLHFFRITFFNLSALFYLTFPYPFTQDVADLRPGPSMHGFSLHLYKGMLTNCTDQNQSYLLPLNKEKCPFFFLDAIAFLVSTD
jgi:hypothetical protein